MILFLQLEQQISKSDEILKTGKFKGANCVRSFWRTVFLPKRCRFERHFDAFMRFCVISKWKKNQGKLHSQLSLDGSWGSAHTSLCSVYLRSAWSYLGDWWGGGHAELRWPGRVSAARRRKDLALLDLEHHSHLCLTWRRPQTRKPVVWTTPDRFPDRTRPRAWTKPLM